MYESYKCELYVFNPTIRRGFGNGVAAQAGETSPGKWKRGFT